MNHQHWKLNSRTRFNLVLKLLWSQHISFYVLGVISKFLNRNRNISTSQLNGLLHLHLKPINVIISHGSITIPNLEAGFPLRCFQRLSIPDIATEQCPWQDSSYTRGQFTPVLSSLSSKPILVLITPPISRSVDYIFIRLLRARMLAYYKHKPVPDTRNFPALCKSVPTLCRN